MSKSSRGAGEPSSIPAGRSGWCRRGRRAARRGAPQRIAVDSRRRHRRRDRTRATALARGRDRHTGGRRSAHDRSAGLGLHGRRHQVARPRLRVRQSGLELPRAARIDRQLRRQHQARADHVHARRVGGRDGPRLREDRGQAARRAAAQQRRAPARGDGDLQRLLRPRARLPHRRQLARRDRAPAGRRMGAQRAGRRRDDPRLRQVGRRAAVAHAFRRIGGPRLQDGDDAADAAGVDRRGR